MTRGTILSHRHGNNQTGITIAPMKREEIISRLGTKPQIDPAEEIAHRVEFLKNYLTTSRTAGFVLGISGGQDSTLAGKLAQIAAEELRTAGMAAELWAMRLPHGVQFDEDDCRIALEFIQPDHVITTNIKPATDALLEELPQPFSDFNKGNIKARLRMVAQYALAGQHNLLVIGTDHAAENITGFFTKFGDGAADVLPLAGLSKRQGAALLRHLRAPDSTWKKVPTADLEEDRPALSDEEALGITYSEIDTYIENAGEVSPSATARLEHLWRIGEHKRHLPVTPQDTWWH